MTRGAAAGALWSNGIVIDRYAPSLIALAYFACGVVLYTLDLAALVYDDSGPSTQVRVLVLAATCLPILLRRTHPLLGLGLASIPVVVDAALGASLPVWLAYGDLLFAATLYSSALVSTILERAPIVPVVVLAIGFGVALDDLRVGVLVAAMGALLVLLPIWWGRSVRTHREAAATERAKAQALARVAELDRASAVTAERQRLARDLHDIVAGHLSAIAIQSEAALRLRDSDPEQAVTVLESVRSNSVEALREMQTMVALLRSDETHGSGDPHGSDDLHGGDETATAGRLANLPVLVASAEASGTPVTVDAVDLPEMDADVDVTAYRIIQECLTNTTKHAPGQPVCLSIRISGGDLAISVTNPLGDGTPGPAGSAATTTAGQTTAAGQGLRNIADRAAVVGGRARAGAEDGRWRTDVRLPLRDTRRFGHGNGDRS